MNATEKIGKVRVITFFAALIGLGIAIIVAFGRDARGGDTSVWSDLAVLVILGCPFILTLVSLRLLRHDRQRWIWLVSALFSAAIGLPLVFSGVGFFFLAIAICFGWAFAITGPRQTSASS